MSETEDFQTKKLGFCRYITNIL